MLQKGKLSLKEAQGHEFGLSPGSKDSFFALWKALTAYGRSVKSVACSEGDVA